MLLPVAVAYLLLCSLAYLFQRKLMYFPDPSPVRQPDPARFPGVAEVELTTSDHLKLQAWYWPGARPVTLLLLHGNAGHRGHRLPWMADLHALGLGLFILDYRGYGGSQGEPSEAGLRRDAQAAVAWLHQRNLTNLVYLGESLGSGVATDLATLHPPAALILQSGFSSAVDVAAQSYPFLPVRLLMTDRFENTQKLPRLKTPVLVIHGDRDEVIPLALGQKLYDAAPHPKEWFIVPGAQHNDVPEVGGQSYLQAIDQFIRRHTEAPSP